MRFSVLVLLGLLCAFSLPGFARQGVDYEAFSYRVRQLAEVSPYFTVQRLALSAKGRPLWLVSLGLPAPPPGARLVKVYLQAAQHGDEPQCAEALLEFLEHLAADPVHCADLCKRFDFRFVPVVNPDGLVACLRHNGEDVNLNRDWLACTQPETRAVRAFLLEWQPEVFVDLHDLRLDEPHQFAKLEVAHLPDPSAARCELAIAARLSGSLAQKLNMQIIRDGPDLNFTLAHRAVPQFLANCRFSALFESRARVQDHLLFLDAFLEGLETTDSSAWPPATAAGPPSSRPRPAPDKTQGKELLSAEALGLALFFTLVAVVLVWLLWGHEEPPLLAQLARRRGNWW